MRKKAKEKTVTMKTIIMTVFIAMMVACAILVCARNHKVKAYNLVKTYNDYLSVSAANTPGHGSSRLKEYQYGYYYVKCTSISFYGLPPAYQSRSYTIYLRPHTSSGNANSGYLTTYYKSTVGTAYWKPYNSGYEGTGVAHTMYGENDLWGATIYYTWQP